MSSSASLELRCSIIEDMAKKRRQSKRKQAAAEVDDQAEQQVATMNYKDNQGDVIMNLEDLDDDFNNLSEDEPPTAKMRRHKKRKIDDWAKEIIQNFVEAKGTEIQSELRSEILDFGTIENYFREVNRKIKSANTQHAERSYTGGQSAPGPRYLCDIVRGRL